MITNNDPRSWDYKRVHNRVPINKKRLIIILLINLLIILMVSFFCKDYKKIILATIIYYIFCLKYILILIIKIYQKVAPISLRDKCRFEPSCSNYMLQCLEKYGFFKGLKKGINRLKRCNTNDGGYDYP